MTAPPVFGGPDIGVRLHETHAYDCVLYLDNNTNAAAKLTTYAPWADLLWQLAKEEIGKPFQGNGPIVTAVRVMVR